MNIYMAFVKIEDIVITKITAMPIPTAILAFFD
jgi:hypothetical protein